MKVLAMRMIHILGAVLALGGCVNLGGGKLPPSLFSLTSEHSAPAGAMSSGKMADALIVMEPLTDRRLAVQRIPVQVDAANVAYFGLAMWVERPSRLFRNLLAETLRAKGKYLVLDSDADVGQGKMRLAGRLLDMGYDAQRHAAVVRYDALRTDAGGKISSKRFEAIETGVAPTAADLGPALNRAANAVAAQVADWVG